MRISIVIPSYNQGEFIERTIQSVLMQNDPDTEIIVMDGGSTDGTPDILNAYSSQLAVIVSEKDDGQSDALQKGYRRATGQYIGWQNSDDIYLPGSFRRFRHLVSIDQTAGRSPADVYFGNQWVIDSYDNPLYGKIFGPFHLDYLLYAGWNITNQSSFFSKSAIDRVGGFNSSLQYAMDFDLYFRLANSGCRFKWDNRYWGGFRIHQLSKGSTLQTTRMDEYSTLRSMYIPGFKPQIPWKNQFQSRRLILKLRRILWLCFSGNILKMLADKMIPCRTRPIYEK
jgi:glycosyltransferase involved in cell wall biosynthesis